MYDKTIDPKEHVDIYVPHISLYTTKDTIFCHVFFYLTEGSDL